MRIRSVLFAALSGATLLGAAVAQTVPAEDVIQGYGNFFRYRIDGLDPGLFDEPVIQVVQPRKFFIGEKADLQVTVRGGNRPYAFSLIGPALAPGLSFDPRRGTFVGTSKVPSVGSFVMAVQDAKGRISQSDPFTVTWLDDFDETAQHAYPVEALLGGTALPSPQPIFDGSAATDVPVSGFGSTIAVRFDHPIRAKTAVVAFSTEAGFGACSYDLEAKDEEGAWKPVHRAQSLASGGVLSAFNLMPTPRSGFVSADWRVKLTSGCHMRMSELRIASSPPNPPPAWQTPEGLLVAVGPVPLGVSIVAPEQSPYSDVPTRFELAEGSTLPKGFALKANGDLTGPEGEGFPYGRIDFRIRTTDGIGYWTERNYFLTPDAVPARTAYPKTVSVDGGANVRFEMSDGKTGEGEPTATVPASGIMMFDYGRFVRVTGGTVLAGSNAGSLVLEAEAGPDQWVEPSLVGGIAKRWRLINESTAAAVLVEARLDGADYNHPPEWMTAEGPWVASQESLSFAGIRSETGETIQAAAQFPGQRLPLAVTSRNIFDQGPASVAVAPGAVLPPGITLVDNALVLPKGEDFRAGFMQAKLRATDPMGFWSERTIQFKPATVRASSRLPQVQGPGGDVTLVLNDGQSDAAVDLKADEALIWSYGRYVEVKGVSAVVASDPARLTLEAETADGWASPSTVAGVAKRFRIRATGAVSVSEYRLDDAAPMLKPTWTPVSSLRTVNAAQILGENGFRLAISAAERNPYFDDAPVLSTVGKVATGFSFADGGIQVPAGEAFPAGLVRIQLKAVDGYGVFSTQSYPFQPESVLASTVVPRVTGGGVDDPFFILNDGAIGPDARAVHLEKDDAVVFDYRRFVRIERRNVVDASDPALIALEASTEDGWVPVADVNTVSKRYRIRATAAVDVREYRIDAAAAPEAPLWNTSAGPYTVDDRSIVGQSGFTVAFDATTRNPFTSAPPEYTLTSPLPDGFSVRNQVISVINGSAFPSGRVVANIRAQDATGFYADRAFVFNPLSVRARPIKPDVRDPAGKDVFGIMSDGRTSLGVQLKAGEAVTLGYGQWVNANNGAAVSATGSVVVEAATTTGWIPAKDADWIARDFRVRATTDAFLTEVRLDGLPPQSGPYWNTYFQDVVTISSAASIGLSATARSEFSDMTTVVYSAAGTMPPGFSVVGNRLVTPAGEDLPSGLFSVTVRATDSVGIYSDLNVPLQPAAGRAIFSKPTVKATGSDADLFRQMSDGVGTFDASGNPGPAGVSLAAGDSLVFDYGRYVYLYESSVVDATGTSVFEAETAAGWVPSASANNRAKRFRFRATAPSVYREARLDNLEIQRPPVWNTAGTLRTIDQSGLSLALSTSIQSRFGAPLVLSAPATLPQGFALNGTTLTGPAGESFPSGSVGFALRATDAIGFVTDQTFAFAPATVRAKTVVPSNVVDPSGTTVTQILNDDVKGTSAAGVPLTAGQTVTWTFPRYVKIVAAESVVDATVPSALVLETDGGTAGWVPASSLDTGKRFRIRATAATNVREYRLDGVGAFVLPAWTTSATPYEVSPTAIAGQSGLSLQLVAVNNSPFPGAMVYTLVPGSTLPSGFAVSQAGILSLPSADVFPAGRVDVPVRATDPAGNRIDRTFVFLPAGLPASSVVPQTVQSDAGTDVRVAMLDGRSATADQAVTLNAGQSLIYDYGTQWVRISAASVFDVTPSGSVLETIGADGSWIQMSAAPASGFPAATADQGGRRFRLRQVSGTSTLREARLGGLPGLGPTWTTPNGTAYPVDQTTISGVSPSGLTLQLAGTKTALTASAITYAWAPGFTAPTGFSLSADGKLTVPAGESFAARRFDLPVRATTDDYTADRTFVFHPAGAAAAGVAPKTVVADGAGDVRVAMLDGRRAAMDDSATLATNQSIVYTYDRWVQIGAPTSVDAGQTGLSLEAQAGDGSWVQISNAPTSSYPSNAVDRIGRVFRLRQTSLGNTVLREARIGGLPALGPTWTTDNGSNYVANQSTIVGLSPAGLTLPLAATKTAVTTSIVTYATAPGSSLPTGFSLTSDGKFTVPAGESFPYGRVAPTLRATTDDYTADRSFAFNPATVRLNSIAPTSVLDKSGASVVVPLYDGATGTGAGGVTLNANESIVWTYPRYVLNAAAANADGVNLGNIVFEVERTDGEWVAATAMDSIGKRFRIRSTATGTVVREYRLDGAGTFLSPAWVTAAGSRIVTETTIANVSPASLSLQLQATNRSPYSSDPIRFEVAPSSPALPAGFTLTSTGLLTVPKASDFPAGSINFTIRVWDSTGFFTDLAFNFLPEVAAMTAQMPSSVLGPDGADVFVPLYSGLNDSPVALQAGQSIVWTFSRYVTPNAVSVITADRTLQLETPAQDGNWTVVLYSNAPGASTATAAYGKTYRLRNAGTTAATVSAARLGGVGPQAPVWNSTNIDRMVTQFGISGLTSTAVSATQLSTPLSASVVFSGATGLSFSAKPGATLPEGFQILSNGTLNVPVGESFTGGYARISLRVTDSRGFYADRTFGFYPSSVGAYTVAPSTVTDPAGADAFTILYDGNVDRRVTLQQNEAVSVTYPQFVNITRYAVVGYGDTKQSGTLSVETQQADGAWALVSNQTLVVQGTLSDGTPIIGLQTAGVNGTPVNVGRRFRFVNKTTGPLFLNELRIDSGPAYTPSFVTSGGPWEVNQTQVLGTSPGALSLQIATTKAYPLADNALTYALAPTSKALPANFGLSTSGLVVVPQGEAFTNGQIDFTVRATDSRGFYTDRAFTFFASSVLASSVSPATVTGPSGASVYAELYDARTDRTVSLQAGESVVVTYPQQVRLQQQSVFNIPTNQASLVVERPEVDGSWTAIERFTNGSYAGISVATQYRTSKIFRIRNTGSGPLVLAEYRLDAAAPLVPVWTTSTGPFAIGDANLVGQSGLTMPLAATKKSPASGALSYALVAGQSVPTGFSVDPNGTMTVPSAGDLPSGRVDLVVRVTDSLGFFADQSLTFIPDAAPRANTIPPASVTGPNGEDLRVALYDDRSDTSIVLTSGQSVIFTWDRFVKLGSPVKADVSSRPLNTTIYRIERLAQDGSWVTAGSYYFGNNGVATDGTAGSGADQYGRTFRIVYTGATQNTFQELRPDNGPGYGLTITTPTAQRNVDDVTISGVSPSSFNLQLAATTAHPASKSVSWTLRGVTPIAFSLSSGGIVTTPKGSDFPFGRVIVPVQGIDDRGYTRDADYPFVPASVRGNTVIPKSVTGPGGEDLFVSMYDGRLDTKFTLGAGQSITYTYDRFVQLGDYSTRIGMDTTTYAVEVPNQNGGWTPVVGVTNGSGPNYSLDYATSRVFRIRNTLATANTVYNAPLDGAVFFTPTITTSQAARTVAEDGIAGGNPAGFTLQLAATDNYPSAGTLTWSLYRPLPDGYTLSSEGLVTVPAGSAFSNGNVSVYARVTDSRGFTADGVFPFLPQAVRARTVAPLSVIGPNNTDLRISLYDGSTGTVLNTAPGDAITYTYDRFVTVADLTMSTPGFSYSGQYPYFDLMTPDQYGNWVVAGTFSLTSNGYQSDYIYPLFTTSKVFRIVAGRANGIGEFRLDGAPAYNLSIATSQGQRYVDEKGIVNASPAGNSLQLATSTSNPASKKVSWALTSVMPTGFTLSVDGLVTVPNGPDFPFGLVNMPVRATDDQGFFVTGTFPFWAQSVVAKSVAPVSVVGPNGENLRNTLYDGSTNTGLSLQPGQSVTYTYDRFVQVTDGTLSDAYSGYSTASGYYATFTIEIPNQSGGWDTVANLQTTNSFYTWSWGSYGRSSKIFRVRNNGGYAGFLGEFRLDNAPSYAVGITTNATQRFVDASTIRGASPAGLTLQLAATSGHPLAKTQTWAPVSALPTGFTLDARGLLTVPGGADFPYGNITVPVRVTDDQGFSATTSFPFVAGSVRAATVAPVSVVGPSGQDLSVQLYDGDLTATTTLQQGQVVTYTYDQFVNVVDIAQAGNQSGGAYTYGGVSAQLQLETPNQNGSWTPYAVFTTDSNGTINNWYFTASNVASKIWRVVNVNPRVATLREFRLDNPGSYGIAITTVLDGRIVDADGIRGQTTGLTLQLAARSGHPLAAIRNWTLTGVMPTGFTLSSDGLVTVPSGPDFPFGYVTMPVRVTDDKGFTATATFPFNAGSVRANTVPPLSVVGPNGEDMSVPLQDGTISTVVGLQAGQSITWTYDRFVIVGDITTAANAYAATITSGALYLEMPNQAGGWDVLAVFGANGPMSVVPSWNITGRSSKIFRFRNGGAQPMTIGELRLDNAPSYGASVTTSQALREVGTAIVGSSPAALSLQLAALSRHPQAAGFAWTLTGVLPTGFTLTSDGLVTVPAGPDFPFGYVAMPVQAKDTKNFVAAGTFPFRPSSVRANSIKPTSVAGSNSEDLLAKLYDGDASTAYALQSGASVTWTYDRYVSVQDFTIPSAAYVATAGSSGTLYLEVPLANGLWQITHTFVNNGTTFTSSAIGQADYNQSKVFRLRNGLGSAVTLKEFRLDNPASYGLTWAQSGGTFFVGEDRIGATNGGAAAPSTAGLQLTFGATSGYPGGQNVVYSWKPGFTPPAGFVLADGVLTVPPGSAFAAGEAVLQIRATDALGFHTLDRQFAFVPASVRANTIAPTSVVDAAGQSVYVGLYDDDASTSSTVATTLQPGQSITWTYPQYVYLGALSSVVAPSSSTNVLVERQMPDGSWQGAESRAMTGTTSSGLALSDQAPQKVWRLRNTGSTAAPLIEWRLDGAATFSPSISTTLATRYVTPTAIVDAIGGTSPSPGSSGLTLVLAGTPRSPGGGTLTWTWGSDFTPPQGFSLGADGTLTVPAREAFPAGTVQLPVKATDPRGFAIARVVNLSADPVRASSILAPGTVAVVGPNNTNYFDAMVDGLPAQVATLQPGESISWSFQRYVSVQAAASANVSAGTWQLEVPNQIGGWTLVENASGLKGGVDARIARIYRLRNTGTAAITVGEYNIDGAAQAGNPSPIGYSADYKGNLTVGNYSGSDATYQLRYAANDPYRGGALTYAATGLPTGVTVSSTGLVSIAAGNSYLDYASFTVATTNAMGRSASSVFSIADTRAKVIAQYSGYRAYTDGTYARSCAAYAKPANGYLYQGATGDGVYRIDPDGPTGGASPTDVSCSEMSAGVGGATTIPAMVQGYQGFPGHNRSTGMYRVQSGWQTFYLALAAVSSTQTVYLMGSSESCCDPYAWQNVNGGQLGATRGGLGAAYYTYTLSNNSGNAFWFSTYSTDGSVDGGGGLYVDTNTIFR